MELLNRIERSEKGQGLVEYGLILALVSVVAVGTIGGVGDKVTSTFSSVDHAMGGGVYTEEEIDDMINNEGYIPVSSADELQSVKNPSGSVSQNAESLLFGKGTKWEGEYVYGLHKKYIQVSDIDLSGIDNFEPIGTSHHSFGGVFDGGGYAINNLTINCPNDSRIGLFGLAYESAIKNVGLNNVNVKGYNWVGGLVGDNLGAKIHNSYVIGSVEGLTHVGGLAGVNAYRSEVSNSYAIVNVIGSGSNSGGLVGWNYDHSSVLDSYASGSVTGNIRVGGLVGWNHTTAEISNSYSSVNLQGGEAIGGMVGTNHNKSSVVESGWDNSKYDVGVGISSAGSIETNSKGYTTETINNIINGLVK